MLSRVELEKSFITFGSGKHEILFAINMRMPTNVGIFRFISIEISHLAKLSKKTNVLMTNYR